MNLRDKTLPELAALLWRIRLAGWALKAGTLTITAGRALVALGERLAPRT
ncbi:hypothetical protein [Methylocystis sp. ATCC 49242]|nr:hypothetical protein [Methylocystis sp. ATCC 49242]